MAEEIDSMVPKRPVTFPPCRATEAVVVDSILGPVDPPIRVRYRNEAVFGPVAAPLLPKQRRSTF